MHRMLTSQPSQVGAKIWACFPHNLIDVHEREVIQVRCQQT